MIKTLRYMNPFIINNFTKELLELYIKYNRGNFRMYDIFDLHNHVTDETALLTVQEFYNKSYLDNSIGGK